MTALTSDPLYRRSVEGQLREFCKRKRIKLASVAWEDGRIRPCCARADYRFVHDAAETIQHTAAVTLAYYYYRRTDPSIPRLPVDFLHEPLVRRLDEISREHFLLSGRADEMRKEYEASTRAMRRAERQTSKPRKPKAKGKRTSSARRTTRAAGAMQIAA